MKEGIASQMLTSVSGLTGLPSKGPELSLIGLT